MTRWRLRGSGAPLLAVAALGCGGTHDDAGSSGSIPDTPSYALSPELVAEFEGTYRLDSLTDNAAGCDVDGPSVLTTTTEPKFVLLGTPDEPPYLVLESCADDVACALNAGEIRDPNATYYSGQYVHVFSSHLGERLEEGAVGPGTVSGGQCVGREWYATELTQTGESVRAETRTTLLPEGPADKYCTTGGFDWDEEAKTLPCSELRVLTGTRTGPPPGG
jgi:hypothetical protein